MFAWVCACYRFWRFTNSSQQWMNSVKKALTPNRWQHCTTWGNIALTKRHGFKWSRVTYQRRGRAAVPLERLRGCWDMAKRPTWNCQNGNPPMHGNGKSRLFVAYTNNLENTPLPLSYARLTGAGWFFKPLLWMIFKITNFRNLQQQCAIMTSHG